MKVSELMEKLQECNPNAEVLLPNINELNIPGYCVMDHLISFQFNEVVSDIIDNPGEIDCRLLKNKKDDTFIVYLGSKYGRIGQNMTLSETSNYHRCNYYRGAKTAIYPPT